MKKLKPGFFSEIKSDLPASLVVFLVAMPLCLGIAMASGAPLLAGVIAGAIGGIVVGALSGSALGVSGPAAGLAVIVWSAINDLGSYEAFLLAVVLSGVIQILMGYLRAGLIAYYFPSAVINGMLAAIGIIIILKQIPHAVGYDADYEGDISFQQLDSENTFSEIVKMLDYLSFGPMLIVAISLFILILWETPRFKKNPVTQLIQGPLVAVVVGIFLGQLFSGWESFALSPTQLVNIPLFMGFSDVVAALRLPDFTQVLNYEIYLTAFVIATVGSLETLLCVEASDQQDPYKRLTPTNRELKAQGVGNILSGLIGGLPITQVIVRSSVNSQAGGKTKLSTIAHGFIILISLFLIPNLINKIPLASLAAILFIVGYKLAKPSLFKKAWSRGFEQFVPFVATIVSIIFTDLLVGITIGFAVALFFVLRNHYRIPFVVDDELAKDGHIIIELGEDVSFLKKASLRKFLARIPDGRHVTIDASKTYFIHRDVIDIIEDFQVGAQYRGIQVELLELYDHKSEDSVIHYRVSSPDKKRP